MDSAEQGWIAALIRSRRATNGTNTPRDYKFSPDGSQLFFLGSDASQPLHDAPRSTLYRVPVPTVLPADGPPSLKWTPVVPCLSPSNSTTGAEKETETNGEQQSKELALLRERMRTVTQGLNDYVMHARSNVLLLPFAGCLYSTPLSGLHLSSPAPPPAPLGSSPPLGTRTQTSPILDPKPSPDGRLVAFVRDCDLWVLCVTSGRERQLTDSSDSDVDGERGRGGEGGNTEPRPRTCGVAEYVMQEEFDRFSAFWWSPVRNPSTGCFELLYLAVNQEHVPIVRLPLYALDEGAEYYHYPRPGDDNAISTPRVLRVPDPPLDGGREALDAWAAENPRKFEESEMWTPRVPIQEQFPWAEYVVRAGWLPSGTGTMGTLLYGIRGFWLTLLDRRQKRMEVVAFPAFADGQGVVLLSEKSHDFWINVNDNLRFLKSRRAMLYTSEISGCAHLYYAKVPQLGEPLGGPPSPPRNSPPVTDVPVDPRTVTAGDDWVVEDIVGVDEARELVYYSSTKGGHLEKHLCVSSFAQTRAPPADNVRLLTPIGFTYTSMSMDTLCMRVALNFSSLRSDTRSEVYSIGGLAAKDSGTPQKLDDIELNLMASVENPVLHPSNMAPWATPTPELFTFKSEDGTMLNGAFYVPRSGDGTAMKGPHKTVLVVYGGPHVQLVRNERRLTNSLKSQMLAARGYAVVMIDGRGSFRRGARFESAIRGRFGGAELRDQVAGIEHLAARGIVDRSRVAVTGWSYGAYAAAMLLARWGSLFRVAICGAPVTRWEGYDAAYTERYLGLLDENAAGYSLSSVLAHAEGLPKEGGRLMLVHSLMDENVHASHTVALVDVLVRENKQHSLVLFPRERHGLRDPAAQLHFETAFCNFLERNM